MCIFLGATGMLYQIQYLRAVAVLAVLYFHSIEVLLGHGFRVGSILHDVGPVGVDLFFVISGFIMAYIVAKGDIDTIPFLLKRIIRIAPMYWFATLFVFLMAAWFPSLLKSTTADPIQLLHSLLFIPNGQNSASSAPILVIGWTLNYEIFFYLLVAVAAGVLKDRRLISVIFMIIALSLFGLLISPNNGYMEFYTDPILLEFGFGVIVHHIWYRKIKLMPRAISLTIIGLMVAIIVLTKQYYLSDARPFIWGLPAAFIVYAAMNLSFGAQTILKKIGDWSYEIYIWHVFIITGLVKLATQIPSILIPTTDIVFSLLALLIAVLGTYILFAKVRSKR